MKISLEWLKDYLKRDLSAEESSFALTQVGFEVEGIETVGVPPLDKVVVGEILSREPHPDADRLGVCMVRVEPDGDPLQIVCGATNYKVGDRVPTALQGAVLPGGFKIKKSKLRGVLSNGMLCSGREIGVGDDHEGLLILDPEAPVGTPINDLFPEPVTVLDIEVTPNRPDCLSHLGIARDLAAWFRDELEYPAIVRVGEEKMTRDGEPLLRKVEVEARDACPRYEAWSIRGVKVGPSPDWLRRRIEAIGLRPINNVVDVTNYVLHELGQPLHAFDSAKIGGAEIRVRYAYEGERIRTLDGKERELIQTDLVIADATRPIVIAGVMGSADVEVDEATTDVVLEAAYFVPRGVRRTSRRLALSTDSSYRFERGVDPAGITFAAERAIDLILETAGGTLMRGRLESGSAPITESEIRIHPEQIREWLGFGPDNEEMRSILEALELAVSENDDTGEWSVAIPSFRQDLTRPVDLLEEILRIHGSHRIPDANVTVPGHHARESSETSLLRGAGSTLAARGFHEAFNYTLRTVEEAVKWGGASAGASLAVANPLASDQSNLRVSLLPGLLDVLRYNQARVDGDFRFFERGRVFVERNGRLFETVAVGFVILEDPKERRWKRREASDFYTVRGILEHLALEAGIELKLADFSPMGSEDPVWMEGRAAQLGDLLSGGMEMRCGFLRPDIVRDWDLAEPVLAGEWIFTPEWIRGMETKTAYQPVSVFPASVKDIAVMVDLASLAGDVAGRIADLAKQTAGEGIAVEDVTCFDDYRGEGLPAGRKSLAFSLRYRAADRTLSEKEINQSFDGLQKVLGESTDFIVRSG